MIFTIISLALIPVIILIILLLVVDRRQREPARLLGKVFLFGVLAAIPVLVIQMVLVRFNVFAGIFGILFQAFIVAGLVEEFMKRLVVMRFAYNHPAFDEKLDGIIYCAFAALGFAAIENVMYLTSYFSEIPSVALYRAIFSVPGHMLFAVTMGYYLSLAKYSQSPAMSRNYYSKSLLYPVLLHGTFNTILSLDLPILLVFVPFIVFLWIYNMKKLNTFYRESKNNHS
ncbi:MAG: PrsW family glutamic-type intramembrane protease [Clostridia bacterium]|nr:PrsW family glutamic-type intramembrane protease [Clostridia bacterium]